jgi:hypothetical protein
MENEYMNRKFAYAIVLGIAVSTLPAFAIDEVAELRSQLAAVTKRLDELENKPALEAKSSWADKVQIKGDLRYRYEYIEASDIDSDKNRQRIRVRLGAYADVNEATKVGIRIRTNAGQNSGNQTIGDEWDAKETFFDLAYITVAPEGGKYGAATLGKMKYPWKVVTDMLWDSDINPEGIAYQHSAKLGEANLFGSTGYFKVDEESENSNDLDLIAFQGGWTQALCENAKLTLGGSYFHYEDKMAAFPVNYRVAEGFAELGIKKLLPVPVKFYGGYANNIEESNDDEGVIAGIKFADAKKGKWEIKVDYRDVDANTTPDYLVDSDFAGGGTDVEGARLKAKYNLFKNLQLGTTYISGEQKSTEADVDTFHLDLVAKF